MKDRQSEDTIKLNPYQQAAYWIVSRLRYKVKEIFVEGFSYPSTDDVLSIFLNIFGDFDDVEWRYLYLKLSKAIEEEVNNLTSEMKWFIQDESLNCHNRLNEIISEIVDLEVPDMCLSPNNSQKTYFFVSKDKASYWVKSQQYPNNLNLEYSRRYNYVLTGNKEELKFYNTIKATIFHLLEDDCKYSLDRVLDLFCEEYMKHYKIDDREEEKIKEEFLRVLNDKYQIRDGYLDQDTRLMVIIDDLNANGIDDCKDIGKLFADNIRNNIKDIQKKKVI